MDEKIAEYLTHAVEIAVENVGAQGGPFGAIVVAADGQVFEGTNRVTATNDPTAHAEVVAIRRACRELGTFSLAGASLYSSCEPCPLCLSAALWSRLERVYFAADRHDAARVGFDDAAFYDYIQGRGEASLMPVSQIVVPTSQEPFRSWEELDAKTEY
ncbi:guanine deaminase GuaD [Arthrobacter crystallopoietes BAB-32]|uniref:Guanine deaminase GuaD n=1 Tax=Arthrobacter crystallopoietes BAB-32 TaxID=1246476 RepID=N1V513_9MICC|nr:nucleoside deaminase [Arthrobacter crystallopoietes]EMY35177.1 guanine deaminase GuaD [Arthrobacter crystallopoietes BAB-32]